MAGSLADETLARFEILKASGHTGGNISMRFLKNLHHI